MPWLCCSAPRAVSTITLLGLAEQAASARSSAAGTPVTRSTRSGHHAATDRRTSSKPVVRAATYSSSTRAVGDRAGAAARARAARSVPGTGWRNSVGAVGGRACAAGRSTTTLAAALAEPVEVPRGRRHRLGEVGADEHQHVGLLDVGQRERQPAVDAERLVAGRRRRRHAPAAVVVDLAGAERDPGELAELVGLLVGQPAAAEDRDRVRRRASSRSSPQPRRRPGRAPRPSRRRGARRSSRSRTSGRGQPLAVAAQPGGGPALAAQRPLVDRELRPRLHLQARDRASTASCRTGASSRGSGSVVGHGQMPAPRPGWRLGARDGRRR